MYLTRLDGALRQLLQLGSYAMCDVRSYEDDQKSDFWYLVFVNKNNTYPGTYVNLVGQISATFLLDPTLKSLDVQALFTLDAKSGDITCHFVGHGKMHLPGIANSSGMRYGIVDVENSITQYLATGLPTGVRVLQGTKAILKINGQIIGELSGNISAAPVRLFECDCGGRKLGYKDDELHGHAQWCKLVTGKIEEVDGNGD